jgi:hypothetical protein
MRKANVFPDPVFAAPKTSRPANSGGIARCWISVIVSKPIPSIALMVCPERLSSLNFCGSEIAGNDTGFMEGSTGVSVSVSSPAITIRSTFSRCSKEFSWPLLIPQLSFGILSFCFLGAREGSGGFELTFRMVSGFFEDRLLRELSS